MIQKPRGTLDILPSDSVKWQYVEDIIRNICKSYGFAEIRVPTFEATELFQRGMGDATDVVQKEMYTFTDRENRSYTLRPEGTANVIRSVIENSLYGDALPLKLYYIMSCFRYEKPQAGRSREYYTFGIEQVGATSPIVDGEVISLADTLFRKLGIGNIAININTIGCMKDDCRPKYNKILKEYLRESYDNLCDACKSRFERNPTRILDCKSDICKNIVANAPKHKDYVCVECKEHFDKLQIYLRSSGIEFIINPLIVRGFDYYTKTVFEFTSKSVGAQDALGGGGRYDGLSELIGGPKLPGIGFGLGLTRIIMALENIGGYFPERDKPLIYIAALSDDKAKETAVALVRKLRDSNVYAETDNMERSLKSQMKYADKIGAKFVYIIGDKEVAEKKAVLKNMRTSEQNEVGFDELIKRLER
ncbi:MAG: histidine--tRNA ligase [Oscillospiraceae bacterium]|nr:histidine--tRNA ligase [Oscillospiraceae bacterium]